MKNTSNKGKNTALIAYLTIIGTIIAIFMNTEENKDEFASFHIRQALGIFLSFFLLGYFVSYFDSWMASSAFYLFYFVLWIYGFLGVLQEKKKTVPLLGELFQQTFKNI
jgi:uncharacterized membrane protein